jgi:hypothetical protein
MVMLRNVQATIIIAGSLSDRFVTQCSSPASKEYYLATYPNKIFLTFVSQTSDSTAFYYLNVQYQTYKSTSYVNDIKCANVSNFFVTSIPTPNPVTPTPKPAIPSPPT